ncbi:YodC family protein [Mucilaginibacter kameinonensis]|uniref:YodC family protein n=1 Tax=Mucilaginibacter kameinonensis TaxID=452286 RepID=UPI000EF7C0C7|nr:DUF2158 domain-containing protein [Mucilaginibacter kameinonensis]
MEETTEKLKPGDVVQLKSGGPEMTVDSYHINGGWTCKWFLDAELKSGQFVETSLTKNITPKRRGSIPPQ